MRILIDIRCLNDGRHTGVEEYVRELLRHLLAIDRENTYLLFTNAWGDIPADFSWLSRYANVRLMRFRWPNKLLNLSLWYLRRPRLDRLVGGADVVFIPNLNFVAVSRGTPLVVTAHDLSFELYPETFSWRRRLWHFLVNFPGLTRRAARVIAVSRSTAGDLRHFYGLAEERIAVVPSGLDKRFRPIDRNRPELLAVKEKYGLPYRFILHLGTLEPRKNLAALIRAFEKLHAEGTDETRKYALVIAGSDGWRAEETMAAVLASPVRDKILHIGFVEEDDKAALYNLATLFVYPSFYEGFGFPPLEAAAAGTPVIASETSAFPETLGEGALLVDPWQPEELYQAMRAVLTDQSLRERLKRTGSERARGFDWETAARETLTVLTEAATHPRP